MKTGRTNVGSHFVTSTSQADGFQETVSMHAVGSVTLLPHTFRCPRSVRWAVTALVLSTTWHSFVPRDYHLNPHPSTWPESLITF